MKARKIATLIACMIPLLVVGFTAPASAFHHFEDITYWNDVGTGSWTITGFEHHLTSGSLSLGTPTEIDYDDSFSVPGASYGDNSPAQSVVPYADNPEVTIQIFFDPNDPHLAGYAPVIGAPPMTYPFLADWVTQVMGIAGAPVPPYAPYPDDTDFLNPADVYCNLYGTQSIDMLDSGRHVHVPEWQFNHWAPGDPAAAGKILPYDVMTFHASAFSDPVNDPDLIYFNKNYSAVKLWINIDEAMIAKAVSLYLAALDPTPANDPWDYFEVPFNPGDYLKLGRISIIRADTGEELASIGFTADPATSNYWITQGTQLISSDQSTAISAPLPFQNPAAVDPDPDKDVEIDKIALPGDTIGWILYNTTSFDFAAGVFDYNLGTDDDDATILNVMYDGTTVLDPKFYDINTAPSPDTITIHSDDPEFPSDLDDGDKVTVETSYPERAGIAAFAPGAWYQVELSVDYLQNTMFKAYDGDGFLIVEKDVADFSGSGAFDGDLMIYGIFGSPVADGIYIVPPVSHSLLRIDDVKPTREAMESHESNIIDYIDNLEGKANYAAALPVANYGNRSIGISFKDVFPSDADPLFDPWMSDYGIQLFEFADPVNTSKFIQVLLVPSSVTTLIPAQYLKDFGTAVTEAVFFLLIMDGTKSPEGLPQPVHFRAVGLDVSILPDATSMTVKWNTTGGYTLMYDGFADPDPFDGDFSVVDMTFSFSGTSKFPAADRLGSGMLSYTADAGYGVETRIINTTVDVNTVPDAPVLSLPVMAGHNSTHATIDLSWSSVASANNYTIYYQNTGKPVRTIKGVSGTEKTITVHDQSGSYAFWVAAVNGSGESARSNVQSLDIILELVPPAITSVNYIVAANLKSATIQVNWTAVSVATGYKIYRSTDNITYALAGTSTSPAFSEVLSVTGTYYYEVTATISATESGISKDVHVFVDLNYPGTPAVVIMPSTTTNGIIHVDWLATTLAARYLVYMSTSPTVVRNATTLVANVSTSGVYYNITAGNGTYYFVVVAVSADKKMSLPSNTASVVAAITPPSPQPLSLLDQIIKWIQDLWGAIMAFFASIIGILLGTALIKNKRTPKDCIGGQCNI